MLVYFIADLHLVENRPDITACFLSFLENDAINATQLYILGDLFETWIGDDDDSAFHQSIITALLRLSQTNTKIYFIHGNRDFIIGKKFAKQSGITILPESTVIDLFGQQTVIMHGDTLCTKDIAYQKFRKMSRSWWWQSLMLLMPLSYRRNKAKQIRAISKNDTKEKTADIMDVTQSEVEKVLIDNKSLLLIHGHTHRPAIHHFTLQGQKAKRIVLGDWYEQGAWLKVTQNTMQLLNHEFNHVDRNTEPL